MLTNERTLMLRRLLLASAVLGAALAAAAVGTAGTRAVPKLTGEDGPGFTIEVKLGGKDLKTLKAGRYKLKVDERSSSHNSTCSGRA